MRSIDTDTFLADHRVPRMVALSYDPLAAVNVDLMMGSPLALDADERAVLAEHGLVISSCVGRRVNDPRYPSAG